MKDRNTRLLSTRPLEKTLVDEAFKHRIVIDSIAFIETQNIIDNAVSEEIKRLASARIDAVFTSMNGAEAVIQILHRYRLTPHWKIYCIGAATQSFIKDYFGSDHIAATGKNAVELSEAIIKDNTQKIVFFCGNQRREELPKYLKNQKIEVKEIIVYQTNEIPAKVDKDYDGILFFSPSAVKSFFSVNSILPDTVLFSIGDTTADTIRKKSNNKIVVSDFPSKDKLVEIAIKYFNEELER